MYKSSKHIEKYEISCSENIHIYISSKSVAAFGHMNIFVSELLLSNKSNKFDD